MDSFRLNSVTVRIPCLLNVIATATQWLSIRVGWHAALGAHVELVGTKDSVHIRGPTSCDWGSRHSTACIANRCKLFENRQVRPRDRCAILLQNAVRYLSLRGCIYQSRINNCARYRSIHGRALEASRLLYFDDVRICFTLPGH